MTEQAEGTVAAVVAATSVVNPYEIVFETKEACQGFIDRCVVRWSWALGLENRPVEVPNIMSDAKAEKMFVDQWQARARRVGGVVHDTQHTSYTKQGDDVRLDPYVIITKHGAKAFTIANKY